MAAIVAGAVAIGGAAIGHSARSDREEPPASVDEALDYLQEMSGI